MKNSYSTLILSLIILILSSCGPTISGKDEQSFKTSRAKMEEKLNKAEKVNLEKALRVIALKAMKEKWNFPEKYESKSFDEISMEMIDGKSYSAIISYAEDFLTTDKKEKIAQKTTEIDSLEKSKADVANIIKQLDAFKLTKISISEDEGFDETQPYLDLVFTNKSGEDLIGDYMFHIEIFSKKTGEKIAAQGQGGAFSDDYAIKPNETYEHHQPLLSEARAHSNLWQTAKYPITDFSPYDLVIKAYATKITTKKGGTIERPKTDIAYFDNKIKTLKNEIKELEKSKGTLDELELTDK
ncbi:DUF6694 family lipoprotein [Pedobacter ureilyticus]|uniref:DUF6694 family lipoprotein n=1 Tax=Pedobacter ureilyticus TaxID=1393051 RepID=A0ABW9J303_9SPHI|nr:DUF6694 family lipoprotein [Pedobacter helvus]